MSDTLRRTALQRKTGLRRTPMPKGTATLARKRIRTSTRNTGPTDEVRELVRRRATGCCERCDTVLWHDGRWIAAHSFHHRRPRGMGGSRREDTNSPANLLLLCGSATDGCHAWVESNRLQAIDDGYLVLQGTDPASVPVRMSLTSIRLTHDGDYEDAA